MSLPPTPLSPRPHPPTPAQVIRNYHGHLSGVYSLALHPTLDLLMTGGRDSVCRVWDIRSRTQVFVLSGHTNTVASILTEKVDPQVRGARRRLSHSTYAGTDASRPQW